MSPVIPHLLTFSEFAKVATVVPLIGHGRTAEVLVGGTCIGFVDSLGESGLREAHRKHVNNALYFNQRVSASPTFVCPPPAEVVREYPELEKTFPAEVRFILDNPDLRLQMLGLKSLRLRGPELLALEAARQLDHMSVDSASDLLVVKTDYEELTLRVCGIDADAFYEWIWPDGDPHGDVFDEIPASVLTLVKAVMASALA